jgi:hypothetical protein
MLRGWVAPAENMVGRAPLIPLFLAGNFTPTIPHLFSQCKVSGFPFGCADTAAADGRRGSNVYEVNPWLWQFGRGTWRPRLGGLTVEQTTVVRQAHASEARKKPGAETRRSRNADQAWFKVKCGVRLYDTSYTSIYLYILVNISISDAWSAQFFFFSTLTPGCDARCMGTWCMHVTQSETYAEVRNLGVKAQGRYQSTTVINYTHMQCSDVNLFWNGMSQDILVYPGIYNDIQVYLMHGLHIGFVTFDCRKRCSVHGG